MLSWIYPNICALCKQRSDLEGALCSSCMQEQARVPRPICLYCGAHVDDHLPYPDRCPDCEGKTRPFLMARSALFRNEQTMELIHRLKFCGEIYLARACAPLLAEIWERYPELHQYKDWTLIPVPVSRRRLFSRRYNQAEELALELSKLRGKMPILQPLKRISSNILSQATLSASQRQAHAQAVYRLKGPYEKGKKSLPPHLLLVDDVYTTGATSRACVRLLKKVAGVKKVAVITLLRVPKEHQA